MPLGALADLAAGPVLPALARGDAEAGDLAASVTVRISGSAPRLPIRVTRFREPDIASFLHVIPERGSRPHARCASSRMRSPGAGGRARPHPERRGLGAGGSKANDTAAPRTGGAERGEGGDAEAGTDPVQTAAIREGAHLG